MSNVTFKNREITFKVQGKENTSAVKHDKEAIHITAHSIEIERSN